MVSDIQCEAGFSHTGTGRQQNQVGTVQAGDGFIQIPDPGGNALKLVAVRGIEKVQPVKGLDNNLVDPLQALHIFSPADIKNPLLRRIQQGGRVVSSLRGLLQDIPGGSDQSADVVFIPDDARVGFHIGNRRHDLSQLQKIGFPIHLVKGRVLLQLVQHGDEIHRLAQGEHFQHSVVNHPVVGQVEVFGPRKDLRDSVQTGGIQQDRSQNRLLRLRAVGQVQPVVAGGH